MAAGWTGQHRRVTPLGLKLAHLLRSAGFFPGMQGVMALGGPPAFLSSSSLSDPPEELLSEATRGSFFAAPEGASASVHTRKRQGGGKMSFGVGVQSGSGALRMEVPTHRSSCGCVWLVYRHHCCPSPQESCTWVPSLCCTKSARTRCTEPHLFWQNHHLCDWTSCPACSSLPLTQLGNVSVLTWIKDS